MQNIKKLAIRMLQVCPWFCWCKSCQWIYTELLVYISFM